jgi:hypothetical protein
LGGTGLEQLGKRAARCSRDLPVRRVAEETPRVLSKRQRLNSQKTMVSSGTCGRKGLACGGELVFRSLEGKRSRGADNDAVGSRTLSRQQNRQLTRHGPSIEPSLIRSGEHVRPDLTHFCGPQPTLIISKPEPAGIRAALSGLDFLRVGNRSHTAASDSSTGDGYHYEPNWI